MAALIEGPDPTDVVGRRVGAWILDGVIGYFVSLSLIYAFGLPEMIEQPSERAGEVNPDVLLAALLALLIIAVVFFAIRVVLIGVFGWTFGKLMLGLRVVRYDGRPPGIGRALVRSSVDGLGQGLLGCLYDIPALFFAMTTAGHRQPADMAANTYVIDSYYLGRLIVRRGDRVVAGPASMTREEFDEYLHAHGMPTSFRPPDGRITEPFYDKGLDTHVVFSKKRNEWLRYDKKSGAWVPVEPTAAGP